MSLLKPTLGAVVTDDVQETRAAEETDGDEKETVTEADLRARWTRYETLRPRMLVLLVLLVHAALGTPLRKVLGRRELKLYIKTVLDRQDKKFYGVTKDWLLHILDNRKQWLISKKDVEQAVLNHVKSWETYNMLRLWRAFDDANDSLPAALRIEIDIHDIEFDSFFGGEDDNNNQAAEQEEEEDNNDSTVETTTTGTAMTDDYEEEEGEEET